MINIVELAFGGKIRRNKRYSKHAKCTRLASVYVYSQFTIRTQLKCSDKNKDDDDDDDSEQRR